MRSKSSIPRICQQCDTEFLDRSGKARKYCSRRCGGLARRSSGTERNCLQCGIEFRAPPWTTKRGGGKLCSRLCADLFKTRPEEERFWEKVNRNGPILVSDLGECWARSGANNGKGYGVFMRAGRGKVLAHRFAYELTYGPIPDELQVLHKCDNPPCCRPDHLFLGDAAANSADMVRKGRQARGEKSSRAKLTEEKVREIRAAVAGGTKQADVCRAFGMSTMAISDLVRRVNWKHVL